LLSGPLRTIDCGNALGEGSILEMQGRLHEELCYQKTSGSIIFNEFIQLISIIGSFYLLYF
jgi:hypothetical protein